MKTIYEFEVPAELTEEIKEKQFKVIGLERLYKSFMSDTEFTFTEEKIDALKNEYFQANADYEQAKKKIQDLLPKEYTSSDMSWNLDFSNNKVTVSK